MRVKIAIVGATGTVGQKAMALLQNHPTFEIAEVVASEKNVGKTYGEIIHWREKTALPEKIAKLKIISYRDITSTYAISSIPATSAKIIEKELAEKGINVISNASAYRMDPTVPLIIPEINGNHISLTDKQSTKGKIVTNSNCSTMFLALGLYPLTQLGKLAHVSVTTLQALSGAGYPGVSSMDILGNVIPYINGEEDKIETEPKKILGTAEKAADFPITVNVNRVPVLHGHSIDIHAFFETDMDAAKVATHFKNLAKEQPELYCYYDQPDRPQPYKDLKDDDQRTHIGRVRQGGTSNVVTLVAMGHNLVRGAAGAAMLNLEHLHKYLEGKK